MALTPDPSPASGRGETRAPDPYPSPVAGEGGRAKRGRMRGSRRKAYCRWSIAPLTPDPSPARGEGKRDMISPFRPHGLSSA
jgi:hypothetical protein